MKKSVAKYDNAVQRGQVLCQNLIRSNEELRAVLQVGVVSDFDLLSLEGVQGKMEVRLFEQGGRAVGGERCHLEQLL